MLFVYSIHNPTQTTQPLMLLMKNNKAYLDSRNGTTVVDSSSNPAMEASNSGGVAQTKHQ